MDLLPFCSFFTAFKLFSLSALMLNKTFKMPAQLAAELMLTAKAGAAPPGPKKWAPGRKLLSID